jgi:xylulokinase
MLGLLAGALAAIQAQGVVARQVTLVGGGARSRALRELAPDLLGVPVHTPPFAEYVALGAARQAAGLIS